MQTPSPDPARTQHKRRPESAAVYSRRRLLTVGLTVATPAALLATFATRDERGPVTSTPLDASRPTGSGPPSPIAQQPTTTATTLAATGYPELDHPLNLGMGGDSKISLLQDRLSSMGFDPGPTDGYFGEATLRAVWAFEKLFVGTPRNEITGIVTPTSWAALHTAPTLAPRRPRTRGRHVEIYLPEQAAALFTDGRSTLITHISSGEGIEWCDTVTVDNDDGTETTKGICGVSVTPGGTYHFERKVAGWRQAALGRLYNPVYFNYGIAIHGASNVPSRPASRGCVRIPMHIAEYFPDLVEIGDDVFVFDGVEEPEHYGAQLPVFDRRDPSYTTTTSSTTSTTSTTTSTTSPPTSVPTSAPAPATSVDRTTTTAPATSSTPTTSVPPTATRTPPATTTIGEPGAPGPPSSG